MGVMAKLTVVHPALVVFAVGGVAKLTVVHPALVVFAVGGVAKLTVVHPALVVFAVGGVAKLTVVHPALVVFAVGVMAKLTVVHPALVVFAVGGVAKLTVVHPALVVSAVGGVAVVAAAVGAAHPPILDQGAADGPPADLEDRASAGLELGVCWLALVLEAARRPQLAVKHKEEHGAAPAVREVGHGVAPVQVQMVLVQIVEILFLHCLSSCHSRSWCNVSRNYCWKIY